MLNSQFVPQYKMLYAMLLMGYPFNKNCPLKLAYDEEKRQWYEAASTGKLELKPAMYFGKLKNGKPDGYGLLMSDNIHNGYSTNYCGKWKEGRFHGKGTLENIFSSHSAIYTGHFKDGLKHGFGKVENMDGTTSGYWENDFFCESGKVNAV